MLTSRMKQAIYFRLGVFIKYSLSGGFYWKRQENRFVLTETFVYWFWCGTYYAGHLFQVALLAYIYYRNIIPDEIPEDGLEQESSNSTVILLTIVGVIIWLVVTCILMIGSTVVQYREEITEGFNQVFALDEYFHRRFPGYSERDLADEKYVKRMEWLVCFICFVPLLTPLVFGCSLFHPSDPIHNIVEKVLEIDIDPRSGFTWVLFLLEVWGVFAFMGTAISAITSISVTVFICEVWMEASTPLSSIAPTFHKGKRYFHTERLGKVGEREVVLVYRCLQLLTGLSNCWVSTRRFAYHTMGTLMMAAIASFAVIKHNQLIVEDGSVMAYGMGLILLGAMVLAVFIYYMECYFVDGMDSKWRLFQENILSSTRPSSSAYKTAKSFRPVTLNTAYPFCNVNKSTFLEWCNIAVDRLVDLLVGS